MNRLLIRPEKRNSQTGITLIEVVVAIALAGTLLTAVLIAGSKHLKQLKNAEQKTLATERLDTFLSAWSVSGFDTEQIPDAVQRSGLAASGDYGVHRIQGAAQNTAGDFQILLQNQGKSGLGDSERVRLSVVSVVKDPLSEGTTPIHRASAEVLVSR